MDDSSIRPGDEAPPEADPSAGGDTPLDQARRLLQRAVPAVREAGAAIERHGGLDKVLDDVAGRVDGLARQARDAAANATAIEGSVVERTTSGGDDGRDAGTSSGGDVGDAADAALEAAARVERAIPRWLELAVIAAAASYGALRASR